MVQRPMAHPYSHRKSTANPSLERTSTGLAREPL